MLRFAPSPTGNLHAGNARVAILNYLYAKKNNLNFFLRIDDTDHERSEQKFVDSILDDLEWLKIEYKKVVRQSERLKVYRDVFEQLKQKELIYPCFETLDELSLMRKVQLKMGKPPVYDRSSLKLTKKEISGFLNSGLSPHWRLKLDDKPTRWKDLIHGDINFDNLSVSDPVIFRSDEMPLFTITSVVDDSEFNVTHILRGDDHITNTAAQIKLFSYIDAPIPKFGHFPLMRTKSGDGLSKRLNSLSIKEFKSKKIIPIVITNYLNKIGTSLSVDDADDLQTLVKNFSLSVFSKNSVLFDIDDVLRLNSKFIKSLSFKELKSFTNITIEKEFWEIFKENIDTFDDLSEWLEIVYEGKHSKQKITLATELFDLLCESLPNEINSDTWSKWTQKILKNFEIKSKDLYVNLRMLLTGKKYGPSMNQLLTLLDRDEIIKRINLNCEKTTN